MPEEYLDIGYKSFLPNSHLLTIYDDHYSVSFDITEA